MELLLNLIWLLLVVPAYFLWRASRRYPEVRRSSFVPLVLFCALAMLFPVVSASDDIQAMRPEMEEASRDAITSPHHNRFFSFSPDSTSVPQLAAQVIRHPEVHPSGIVPALLRSSPAAPFLEIPAGRSPPAAAFS